VPAIRDLQSPEYRKLRDELVSAEEALKDQRERVAELRRSLGTTPIDDYVFREAPADRSRNDEGDFFDTRLSDLFSAPGRCLVIQHMMFSPESENGCPMCSMWVDGFEGVAEHLAQRVDFAVVARAPLAKLRDWGRRRGWKRLRLLSSFDNGFNADMGTELAADRQLPGLSVFTRNPAGELLHNYTSEASLAERHHRAMDLLNPVWNVLDLTPEGRGDWMPRHFYDEG
jgi:predicted dithiol-disulfide oxidoreductase (DUF899 family)